MKRMKDRVVITGGAGFVGVNLAKRLLLNGYEVTIIDLENRCSRILFLEPQVREQIEVLYVDVKSDDYSLPEDTSYVIHLAAWPHVDFSYYYPKESIENNILGLVRVMDEALLRKIPVVFTSSVEVYGGVSEQAYTEQDYPKAVSPYGASKQSCENIVYSYQRCYGLQAAIVRLTNLYGPFQLPDRIVPRVTTRLLLGEKVDVEAEVIRDFLYVDDAADAIIAVMQSGKWGELYNISNGYGLSMERIVQEIVKANNHKGTVEVLESHYDKQRGKSLVICNDKIKKELVWKPQTGLQEGIIKTFAWYRDNKDWWIQYEDCIRSDRKGEQFVVDCVRCDENLVTRKKKERNR